MADPKKSDFKAMWNNQQFATATAKVENITGTFALHMLSQAGLQDLNPEAPLVVFDNACGGGILTLQLHSILRGRCPSTYEITCGDLADAMVELVRTRVETESWSNTIAAKIDAQDTKLPSEKFTHVFTNFGVMAFPDPAQALAECYRVLRPGGVCAFSTWSSIPWLDDIKSAVGSIPELPRFRDVSGVDVANIFSAEKIWHDPAAVREYTAKHGFRDVRVEEVRASSVMSEPEEVRALLGPPLTLMMRFFWSESQREEFGNEDTKGKVFKWFEERLKSGPIRWEWSALVTVCRKPGS